MDDPSVEERPRSAEYVVVARRYRPQGFDQLIGQQHVARALSNAIATGRVGHAYLFTGARGVGKTSSARILAKALDCAHGPTATPCNECDICQSISNGSDVDVIEIDGASNRGIDEIRQLRQNVGIRPSRAHFKIYIIDEVHMLTKEAFNALLKTLEEPPEHVKFIFCTTEASKIPITILSRCQRFDFAGIRAPSIAERLEQIAQAEGIQIERQAIELLARRANGSMRDSQSLLEQLLSYGGSPITAADVHALLGTAADTRVLDLAEQLAARNGAAALAQLDSALAEGVDVGQFVEQLLGYFRDCMAVAVGCSAEQLLYASSDAADRIASAAKSWGLETILASIQIVEQTLSRLRYSTQGRTLAEMALVRICSLENLDDITEVIGRVRAAVPTMPAAAEAKKKAHLVSEDSAELSALGVARHDHGPRDAPKLEAGNVALVWREALGRLSDLLAENAALCESVALVSATSAPNCLAVSFRAKYNACKLFCERPEQLAKLEKALSDVAGQPVRVEFVLLEEDAGEQRKNDVARVRTSQRQRVAQVSEHPLVRRAAELFGASIVKVDEPVD